MTKLFWATRASGGGKPAGSGRIRRLLRRLRRGDSGSLMIDGMIAMLITIMLLVFLMSFGFLLYQRWMVSSIANDTATRLAQSYPYPNADPVIGYLNVDMLSNVPLFRYMGEGLKAENQEKGENYGLWSLKLSSLAYPVDGPHITVCAPADSLGRRHVQVKVTAEYEIPFGGALQYFGLDGTITYQATGYAVCMDMLDYINTIDTVKSLSENTFDSSIVDTIDTFRDTLAKVQEAFTVWTSD